MNNFKLTFTLKQHTPIIHFQHDQYGATLRASEVKPKLDKFLIKKLGLTEMVPDGNRQKEVPKEQYKNWFIGNGKQHLALDYKVFFKTDETKIHIIQEGRNNQYGFFFGTIGNEYRNNLKSLIFSDEPIVMEVFINNDHHVENFSLGQIINNNIYLFFLTHNFGTRQSKGFGSFLINDTTISQNDFAISFKLDYSENVNWVERFKVIFDQINLFYKSLRSGINIKKPEYVNGRNEMKDYFYFKSLLFLYAKNSLQVQWDKKTIKQHFFPLSRITRSDGSTLNLPYRLDQQIEKRPNSDQLTFSSQNNKLIKDLFGYSTQESWYSYNATINKDQAIQNGRGEWVKQDEKKQTFQRFQTPFLFKPVIDGKSIYIYIIVKQDKLDEAIRINRDFIISNDRGNNFHIQFPENFNLNDFFTFISNKNNFNISTHVENQFQNKIEYTQLKTIFNQIQKD